MRHIVVFASLLLLTSPAMAQEAVPQNVEGDVSVSQEGRPLHETGAKLITDFICMGDAKCLDKHGDRLTNAAYKVVDVCLEDPDIPKYICLGLVANISNEGGGKEHPSCGNLDRSCVLRCDEMSNNDARHDCFLQCAIEQGIARGTPRWRRIDGCNDHGTSRGPFQMKKRRIAQCRKILGKGFNPFDLEDAARCTGQIIKKTALSKRWPCGKVDNRWLVAFTRVTRGVIRILAEAQPGRWVPSPQGKAVWVPPTEAAIEQICEASGYGLRGLRYYQECGKKCARVKRPEAPPTAGGPTLSQGD